MLDYIKLFPDQGDSLSALDDETCGKIIKALFQYAFKDNVTVFDNSLLQAYWVQLRSHIELCDKKRKAGAIGGKKTQQKKKLEDIDASGVFIAHLAETDPKLAVEIINSDDSASSSAPSSAPSTGSSSASTTASSIDSSDALSTAQSTDSSTGLSTASSNAQTTTQSTGSSSASSSAKAVLQAQEQKRNIKEKVSDGWLDELEKTSKKKKKVKEEDIDYSAILDKYEVTGKLREEFVKFIETRNADSKKKIRTEYTLELLIKHLRKLADDYDTQVAIVEQSVRNGWQDLFELRENNNKFPRQINNVADVANIKPRNPYAEMAKKLGGEGA